MFSNVTNYALMILANYIKIHTYHYGDVIIRQEEIPEYFYIMLEGECKAVMETVIVKDKEEFEKKKHPRKKDDVLSNTSGFNNANNFSTGLTNYKKATKPPLYVKKHKNHPIAEAAFLGGYRENKYRTKNKSIIQLSK